MTNSPRSDGTQKWRTNDGTPQHGMVEYQDRAMRTGTAPGASLTWRLLGHSDDIVRWRPAGNEMGRYSPSNSN